MLSTYRFVGLLLVTKLLSSGDIPVINAVYDAVGIHFINRLLLPLGRREVTNTEMVLWRLQSVLRTSTTVWSVEEVLHTLVNRCLRCGY